MTARAHMADAALHGNDEAAFSLGYDASGAERLSAEHSLYWYALSARNGNDRAIWNAALAAVRIAWFERPGDIRAGERALGWIALAQEAFPEPDQADFMERLRVDILSLWPELEAWEANAEWQARREVFGWLN